MEIPDFCIFCIEDAVVGAHLAKAGSSACYVNIINALAAFSICCI